MAQHDMGGKGSALSSHDGQHLHPCAKVPARPGDAAGGGVPNQLGQAALALSPLARPGHPCELQDPAGSSPVHWPGGYGGPDLPETMTPSMPELPGPARDNDPEHAG